MKRLLLTLCTLVALLSGRTLARDEQAAVDEFKKDVTAMKAWADERQKSFAGNPLAPLQAIGEMVEKSKTINTEGLPADLKDAWTTVLDGFTKVATLVATLPKDPAELQAKLSDPEVQKNFGVQMMAIQQEMAPHMATLKDVAKKYGIESLGKMTGGK